MKLTSSSLDERESRRGWKYEDILCKNKKRIGHDESIGRTVQSKIAYNAVLTQKRGNKMKLTAIIEREGNGYVSLCPELDVASQGDTIEQARDESSGGVRTVF